jgi:hypothetical protein
MFWILQMKADKFLRIYIQIIVKIILRRCGNHRNFGGHHFIRH